MTYGIAGLAQGFNRGQDMYRDDKRMERHEQRIDDQHQRAGESHQMRMRGAEQQYGIAGDQHDAWTDDRAAQLSAEEELAQYAQALQQYEMAGDLSGLERFAGERIFNAPIRFQPGEDSISIFVDDQQVQDVPREQFNAFVRSLNEPGALMQYEEDVRRQLAEAQQGELDHERDIQGRLASRVPGERVTMDEQGQFGIMPPPEDGMGPADQTAKMREARDIASAFGIELDAAWSILMQPRQQAPDAEIRRIADSLMKHDRRLRNDPSAAFEKAGEIYGQTREMGEQYGLNTMRPGGAPTGGGQPGGGQHQPSQEAQSAAQEAAQAIQSGVRPEQIEQRLREVGFNENDIQWIMENSRR